MRVKGVLDEGYSAIEVADYTSRRKQYRFDMQICTYSILDEQDQTELTLLSLSPYSIPRVSMARTMAARDWIVLL